MKCPKLCYENKVSAARISNANTNAHTVYTRTQINKGRLQGQQRPQFELFSHFFLLRTHTDTHTSEFVCKMVMVFICAPLASIAA